MSDARHLTDVCIIGAGPVGLFAIFECGMLGFNCHVVDALDMTGGQCSALYPQKPIFDIPGIPRIDAGKLVERLDRQAAPFNPTFHLGQAVRKLTQTDEFRWLVETSGRAVIDCGAVIIAAGGGAFGPNRPPLPGLAGYEATGAVRYFVTNTEELRGKRVVIAGGGDSAVDWALSLHNIAASVTVVHRRDKFRAAPGSIARLHQLANDGKLQLQIPFQLSSLDGQGGRLNAVVVRDLDGNEHHLESDVLLPFYGLAMDLGPIADWGLRLRQGLILVEPGTCQTSLPSVFAIGDIAFYPGKLKLILSGFAEAAQAAHAIFPMVRPGEELHFEYSTTKGVPGLEDDRPQTVGEA